MNCPSCNSSLEPNARFCGVCGYRIQAAKPAGTGVPARAATPAGGTPQPRPPVGSGPVAQPAAARAAAPRPSPLIKSKPKGDEIYLNQVLNNRFKIESKIGEGGFGAVYRGVQLQTGRKVAIKLLHPEMTKDENLVARFRREGMVLCNLRDAHTITTYDFDTTADGTLYIAMELLEGKSLHQIFHEQAPLEWKRVFKILIEMCSSLAEAHSQGIVHRDLKPENIYLETRPGNPEFVKILDFGIAKVMRGDSIDPQSPQLTATGQTLGTLEYMSPEQLMGKPLDGRSDVYALGVVAYEMTTAQLPFPDAKGPAGLITAQLKQTPKPPSQANAKVALPANADRVILKALEKDKNNRYADVTAMAAALQDVLDAARESTNPHQQSLANANSSQRISPDMLETRRGDPGSLPPPPLPLPAPALTPHPPPQMRLAPPPGASMQMGPTGQLGPSGAMQSAGGPGSGGMAPMGGYGMPGPGLGPASTPQGMAYPTYPQAQRQQSSSSKWIWWVVGLLALGAATGAVLAVVLR